MYVCSKCGSDEVFFDAYVSVNHPEDVRVYDFAFCMSCEYQTTIIREVEPK